MNEYTKPSAISRFLGNGYNLGGLALSASSLFDLASSDLEYGASGITQLNYATKAENLRTSASETELRAAETANMLRKKYLSAVGSATASAAARGADLQGGGTPKAVLEQSSMELGDDMQTIDRNARRQAKSMRTQATIYDKMAEAYGKSSKWALASGLIGAVGKLGAGLAMMYGGNMLDKAINQQQMIPGATVDMGQAYSAAGLV